MSIQEAIASRSRHVLQRGRVMTPARPRNRHEIPRSAPLTRAYRRSPPSRWNTCAQVAPLIACLVSCNSESRPRAATAATEESPPSATAEPGATAKPPADLRTAPVTSAPADRCIAPFSDTPLPPAPAAEDCPAPPLAAEPLQSGTLTFKDGPAIELRVERAETDEERSRGLMYRTSLDENAGMLFTWNDQRPRSFWMKNTCIPLDMIFIDKDNVIVGILEQVPTLNTLPRRVPCPAWRVLEVNAGFSRRHGVRPGQRIAVDF